MAKARVEVAEVHAVDLAAREWKVALGWMNGMRGEGPTVVSSGNGKPGKSRLLWDR